MTPAAWGGLCVALAMVPAVAQSPAYRLRLSDAVGQTSRYRLTFEIRMRAEISDQGEPDARTRQLMESLAAGMEMRTIVEYEQRLMVVASDGERVYHVRWYDYQFTGELGGEEIPPPPGYLESMHDLLSQVARVRTTPTGRTIDVTYSHPRLAGLTEGLEQGGMPTYLPEQPVEVGDSWKGTAEIPVGMGAGGGSLNLELEHTLKEVRPGPEGSIAVIELSGSYSQLQGFEDTRFGVPLHVQASLTGSSLFDIDRGRFVGGRYEIDMFALHAAEGVEIQLTGRANGNLELLNAR
ncbi:MAG: hypothetical protein V3U13_01245 [Gemmatimonadota bacterium]